MIDTRSDQERQADRPTCAHDWAQWRRAPDLIETIDGVTYVRPQWGRYLRDCRRCYQTQTGRGNAYGVNVSPGIVL
jgi:hypothetical protein